MEIIVLQHIKIEDPGYIKDLMIADNVKLTTIELDEGDRIPEDITKFDAMLQDVFDVTGAGDTVISILSSYLSSGKTVSQAVKMANVAAGLSVQKLGSTSVTQQELINATKK